MNWRKEAACADPDVDPAWFFNSAGQRPVRALRVCYSCPVRQECFDAAMSVKNHDDDGVWGGTTFRQRRDIRFNGLTPQEAMAASDEVALSCADDVDFRGVEDDSGACVDCGGVSWLGGLRCKPCYLWHARPHDGGARSGPRGEVRSLAEVRKAS